SVYSEPGSNSPVKSFQTFYSRPSTLNCPLFSFQRARPHSCRDFLTYTRHAFVSTAIFDALISAQVFKNSQTPPLNQPLKLSRPTHRGRWTVDGGRWTVDGGRWTVDGNKS